MTIQLGSLEENNAFVHRAATFWKAPYRGVSARFATYSRDPVYSQSKATRSGARFGIGEAQTSIAGVALGFDTPCTSICTDRVDVKAAQDDGKAQDIPHITVTG